jgi:hypothetical protein
MQEGDWLIVSGIKRWSWQIFGDTVPHATQAFL